MKHRFGAFVTLLCILQAVAGFYLPGVAPVNYKQDTPVNVKVNKIDSVVTQLPYDYYSLPLHESCVPDTLTQVKENLGELLMGDRIFNSQYDVKINVPEKCKIVCDAAYDKKAHAEFAKKIEEQYRAHMILDNLPAATPISVADEKPILKDGYSLGFVGSTKNDRTKEGVSYLNNHLSFRIKVHTDPSWKKSANDPNLFRIVGFEVNAISIANQDADCTPNGLLALNPEAGGRIKFSYSVEWVTSSQKWASRWDSYMQMQDPQIHWFSILNSLMILAFLTIMVAMIMFRTLSHDFKKYNDALDLGPEEVQEETGWILLRSDVFRPPLKPMILSVLCGTGFQVCIITCITMVFAVLGFLSPANRGGLLQAMVALYVCTSVVAGYMAARVYRTSLMGAAGGAGVIVERGKRLQNMLITTFFFPGLVFSLFFVMNLLVWGHHSSQAIPFKYLVGVVSMWFLVSLPLSLLGSWLGFRKPVPEFPVRTNQIPRQIPPQVWYMKPAVSILMGGVLPFGAVFIELFFILSSIWLHRFYYMFGFLFVVFIILAITCVEISVVLCYFQLCSEDYRWWWRSFLTSGSSALYFALYAGFYFLTQLRISAVGSALLYFGYTAIMVVAFFVLTGSVGFYACLLFTKKIYAAVKAD